VPAPAKTLAKDVLRYRRAGAFHVDPAGPWAADGTHLDFVWQRHELFQTAGLDLARALGRPSVLFAPATAVWEAERWGTHRPGWGGLVERLGERPALTTADVVACGAPEVAEQALRLGTDPERVVITPTGVDLDLFDPPADAAARRDAERERLGLADRFVVGGGGSFRPFHSLDRAVAAVAGRPDVALLLVGDGPERPAVEARARELGVHLVCTGTVDHADLPRHLSAMDVGLVLGPADGAFHYSPLKLAEYLAAGLPVVAPAVGTITSRLADGVDALLVDPADPAALGAAVLALQREPELRERLGRAGRATAEAHWSWDEQVRRVVAALERLGRSG
jgi:glycosyltransferase involved in cell wall biosynthesis